MPYVKGRSLLLRHENGEERAILALYGDQNAAGAGWAMEAATAQHPRQAVLSDCQTISTWFRFAELRPYGEVIAKMDQVFDRFKADGWTVSRAIEGLPDTGSSIGDLSNTEDPAHWDLDFPSSPNVAGYNAAQSFVAVFERPGHPPVFTKEEVDHLRQLMDELGQTVFGHPISLEEE